MVNRNVTRFCAILAARFSARTGRMGRAGVRGTGCDDWGLGAAEQAAPHWRQPFQRPPGGAHSGASWSNRRADSQAAGVPCQWGGPADARGAARPSPRPLDRSTPRTVREGYQAIGIPASERGGSTRPRPRPLRPASVRRRPTAVPDAPGRGGVRRGFRSRPPARPAPFPPAGTLVRPTIRSSG